MNVRSFRFLFLALSFTPATGAQDLLVTDVSNRRVVLVDGSDGSVLDPSLIDLTQSTGSAPLVPVQALLVGSEVWISDSGADVVFRFGTDGAYRTEFGSLREDPSGMARIFSFTWVGNRSGALGPALKRYDHTGTLLDFHQTGGTTDPVGVVAWQGGLLVTDPAGHDVDRYDGNGAYLGTFLDGDGVQTLRLPGQLSVSGDLQRVFVAEAGSPAGILELDAGGGILAFHDTESLGFPSLAGVAPLANGDLVFTNADGVHVLHVASGTVTTTYPGANCAFVTALPGPGSATVYCDEQVNPNNTADIAIDTVDSQAPSITLSLTNAPLSQYTFLLVGDGMGVVQHPPGNKGTLCIVGGTCLGRYDKDVGSTGSSGSHQVDIRSAISDPCAGAVLIVPGSSWNFQFWHRQPMGSPSSFSAALAVTFE